MRNRWNLSRMGCHHPHRTFHNRVHWRWQNRLEFHCSKLWGFLRSSYQLPKKAKCASRTKSMTSSSALTLKRSQNQSTAISDDAIVSNMKPWSSERFESEKSCVLFMCLQYTILTPVPILCDTFSIVHQRLPFSIKNVYWERARLVLLCVRN